jgi:hypothetical protein
MNDTTSDAAEVQRLVLRRMSLTQKAALLDGLRNRACARRCRDQATPSRVRRPGSPMGVVANALRGRAVSARLARCSPDRAMTVASVLGVVTGLIDAAQIPYMVVGSFASSLHGEPRTTFDLDIVIDPDRPKLEALLRQVPERFYVDVARRSLFNMIDTETGWKIDLIIRKDRAFSIEELSRRQHASIAGVGVFVASVEDTIIAKLEWAKEGASARQIDDVRRIIGVQQAALDVVYIAKWVAILKLEDQWNTARA